MPAGDQWFLQIIMISRDSWVEEIIYRKFHIFPETFVQKNQKPVVNNITWITWQDSKYLDYFTWKNLKIHSQEIRMINASILLLNKIILILKKGEVYDIWACIYKYIDYRYYIKLYYLYHISKNGQARVYACSHLQQLRCLINLSPNYLWIVGCFVFKIEPAP